MRSRLKTLLVVAALLATGAPVAVAQTQEQEPAVPAPAPAGPRGLPAGTPPAAVRPERPLPSPRTWPFRDGFPRTSGTGRLDAGALQWSDFLYDDHGAAGFQVKAPVTGGSPWQGTYTYADPDAKNNGADIFRAAVGVDRATTWWRVDWNTLVDPTIPIAAWTFDVDADAATGESAWPAGAGVRSAGIERALVVSGTGAWLVDLASGAATPVADVGGSHTVDRSSRSFVVRVPRSALPVARTWRVRLASGVAAADGRSFAPVAQEQGAAPGQPAVYNVAFRDYDDEPAARNYWFEDAQSAALANGDVSAFGVEVNWSELDARVTTAEPLRRGYSNRWYVSSIELDQGWQPEPGGQQDYRPNFLGRVQPYAVYVPSSYDPRAGRRPLTWVLHSYSNGHNEYGARNPKLLQDACERRASICVTGLGRGPDGWYLDEAELDFWELWNRMATSFRLDPERTTISGYSMGGYGTYRLALNHPDLFARALTLNGAVICGIRAAPGVDARGTTEHCRADGDSAPLIGNARWLPFAISRGALDELVPVAGTNDQVGRFAAAGLRYRDELYPTEDHLSQAALDTWWTAGENLAQARRTTRVGRITYSWYPNLDRADLGIGASGAYWIGELAGRSTTPGTLATADATSHAAPDPIVSTTRRQHLSVPPPGAPAGIVTEQTWTTGPRPTPRPLVDVTLTNVARIRIDLPRAGIGPGSRGRLTTRTDGPTTLVLTGLAPGTPVDLGGVTAARADAGGRAVLPLASGDHTVSWPPRS